MEQSSQSGAENEVDQPEAVQESIPEEDKPGVVAVFEALKKSASEKGKAVQLMEGDFSVEEIAIAASVGISTFSDPNAERVDNERRVRFVTVKEDGSLATPEEEVVYRLQEEQSAKARRTSAFQQLALATAGMAGGPDLFAALGKQPKRGRKVLGNTTAKRDAAVKLFETSLGRKPRRGTSMSVVKAVVKTAHSIREAYEKLGEKTTGAQEEDDIDYSEAMKAHELMLKLYEQYGEEEIDLAVQALIDVGHPSLGEAKEEPASAVRD